MQTTCQRCHETLREEDRFCPVCGLPQLFYVAAEAPLVPVEQNSDSHSVSGISLTHSGGDLISTQGIIWRPALRAAMILAVPAAVLCSGLTPIGLVCMAGASAWAVSIYSKRARTGGLTMSTGARIGLLTGLLASWLTLAMDGATLWFTRFVLHQGGQFDSTWTSLVNASFDHNQQMIAQMAVSGAQSAQTLQMTQAMRAWMLSTDGRAGAALMGSLVVAVFLILFGVVGGAVSTRFMKHTGQPRA